MRYPYSFRDYGYLESIFNFDRAHVPPVDGEVRRPSNTPKPFQDLQDITDEAWREYDFGGRVYRIDNPVKLYIKKDGFTHRVLDDKGVVHCVPRPGHDGCVLRWRPRMGRPAVGF